MIQHGGMWYPDEGELFDAGVLNSMAEERIVQDNRLSADNLNARTPARIDDITTLVRARASGTMLTYYYSVSLDEAALDLERAQTSLMTHNRKAICATPAMRRMLSAGAVYHYEYVDPANRVIADFKITRCDA